MSATTSQTATTTITITYTIPGARTLDQLNEPTLDHQPDEDARENCVAASIAEALNILTQPDGSQKYVGDELHDSVYGQGYIGPQAAWRYVTYCHDQGVWLHAVGGSQAALVATIHKQVSAGHPVVVTMPSDWNTPYADPVHPSGSTHVGLAVGIGSGAIRVENPWHGFMQDASDAWWQARLCEGEVWVMEKVSSTVTAAGAAGQPTPFYGLVYTSDAEVWKRAGTAFTLGHGFLSYYQSLKGQSGACATQILGLPTSEEYPTADGKTRQDFERGALIYDAKGSGAWQIYHAPVGQELDTLHAQIAQLQQQIANLEGEIAQLKAAPTPAPPPPALPSAPTPAPSAEEIAQAAGAAFSAAFVAALEKVAS